jgi:hypothetical protein
MSGDCEFARPNTGTRILGFHQQVNLIEPRNDDLRALLWPIGTRSKRPSCCTAEQGYKFASVKRQHWLSPISFEMRCAAPSMRRSLTKLKARTHCACSLLEIHRGIRCSRCREVLRIGTSPAAGQDRCRTAACVVVRGADAPLDGRCGCGLSQRAGANQVAVLRPVSAAAGEHPSRADTAIVVRCAQHDDPAVSG